jgi:hypothetical protein
MSGRIMIMSLICWISLLNQVLTSKEDQLSKQSVINKHRMISYHFYILWQHYEKVIAIINDIVASDTKGLYISSDLRWMLQYNNQFDNEEERRNYKNMMQSKIVQMYQKLVPMGLFIKECKQTGNQELINIAVDYDKKVDNLLNKLQIE